MTTLIDCDFAVIRVKPAASCALLTVITPSVYDGETRQPAESACAHLDAEQIAQLIEALQAPPAMQEAN